MHEITKFDCPFTPSGADLFKDISLKSFLENTKVFFLVHITKEQVPKLNASIKRAI